jgi:hypothetical protein
MVSFAVAKCPSTDEWINKKVACPYDGILFGHKKEYTQHR